MALTRHINGFRPLAEHERWYKDDEWGPEDLPPGWRPYLEGELAGIGQSNYVAKRQKQKEWFVHNNITVRITYAEHRQLLVRTQTPLP